MILALKKIFAKTFPDFFRLWGLTKIEVWNQYLKLKKTSTLHCFSFLTYLYNYYRFGATPEEYHFLHFDKLNRKGKSEFVTMRKNRELDRLFNDKDAIRILWDKGLFNNHFSSFIKRKYVYVDDSTSKEVLNKFFDSLKGKKFIVKPNEMYYGLGIYTGDSLQDLYSVKERKEPVVVEEMIENCTELARLNDSSLNTFRVVTCIDRNRNVNIVGILLRTGKKGSIIDNLLGGGTCYHVDNETGVVDGVGHDAHSNSYVRHPSSSVIMPGFVVPRFDELKKYAIDLAKHLPDARYVGWDIAMVPEGCEVIEGNVCPSAELIQCNGIGLYNTIKSFY